MRVEKLRLHDLTNMEMDMRVRGEGYALHVPVVLRTCIQEGGHAFIRQCCGSVSSPIRNLLAKSDPGPF